MQEPGLRDPQMHRAYVCVDTGLIAGLHNCGRERLWARLALRAGQRVLFAQTVGHPQRRSRGERS